VRVKVQAGGADGGNPWTDLFLTVHCHPSPPCWMLVDALSPRLLDPKPFYSVWARQGSVRRRYSGGEGKGRIISYRLIFAVVLKATRSAWVACGGLGEAGT